MKKYPDWKKSEDILEDLKSHLECLGEVQAFVMGCYYGWLKTILDTSRLAVQEAYGAWTWFDYHLIITISGIVSRCNLRSDPLLRFGELPRSNPSSIQRKDVRQLLAMFFAGAEEHQVTAMNENVLGVHGKITMVSASLLDDTDSPEKAMRFSLLDLDPTTIPSNARGIIHSRRSLSSASLKSTPDDGYLRTIEQVNPSGLDTDFTSHIEPDWDYDVQTCQVVYRYRSRIIRRLSSLDIEQALLPHRRLNALKPRDKGYSVSSKVLLANIDTFFPGCAGHDTRSPDYKINDRYKRMHQGADLYSYYLFSAEL